MTLRTYVKDDFARLGLAIFVVIEPEGQRSRLLRMNVDGSCPTWEEIDPALAVKPTIVLSYDVAQALHTGLDRHFDGTDEARQARRDLEYERTVKDKLLDFVLRMYEVQARRLREYE